MGRGGADGVHTRYIEWWDRLCTSGSGLRGIRKTEYDRTRSSFLQLVPDKKEKQPDPTPQADLMKAGRVEGALDVPIPIARYIS